MADDDASSVDRLVEDFRATTPGEMYEPMPEGFRAKIFDTEWLAVYRLRHPEMPNREYVYAHESRSDGELVAVLPFRKATDGYEYLLRVEMVPPWGLDPVPCALTGGVEDDADAYTDDAIRELYEESGYYATPDELISLGVGRGTKAMDTRYHLYGIDVTGKAPDDPVGDGSVGEYRADTEWVDDIAGVQDPHVHMMWVRLQEVLRGD